MSGFLADMTRPACTRAVKLNLSALFDLLGRAEQTEMERTPVWTRWRTTIPHPWFNGVLVQQPVDAIEPEMAMQTVKYFRSHVAGNFTWWLDPDLDHASWAAYLAANGFHRADDTPGMALDLQGIPPQRPALAGCKIQAVESDAALAIWVRVFVAGYQLPGEWAAPFLDLLRGIGLAWPVRHYLGFWHGKPVATSTLFGAAGVGGIHFVATLPEARGWGIGALMTMQPLYDARAMGYRIGALQSSEMGYSIYRRLGFEHICQMEHFYWQEPGSTL
jgi:GNAT superfamily N-acetyltransferase